MAKVRLTPLEPAEEANSMRIYFLPRSEYQQTFG